MTAHPLDEIEKSLTPLVVSFLSIQLLEVNQILGTLTMFFSLIFAITKLYKEFFSNNNQNKNDHEPN